MGTLDSYISYFTPSEMSHETLEAILVKRQKLVERLVDRVRESVLTAAKHQSILLGPRGMGKSHLVALVYHRVKAIAELDGKIALAWLAEEEWSVAALVDLYVVLLDALEKEYGGLQTRIDALYDLPMRERTGAAADLIRTFIGGRTLFLLVENLEEIFRGLSRDELWAFRSFLSQKPFATILATTPSLFNGINRQEEAFFGFFQPTYLDELTAKEATELLGKLAARREDKALTNFLQTPTAHDRVQAVHDLAGGHPRIYLLFAHLLTQASLDELVTPFLEFLDELTPYYQDRMKVLSPQQRKIVAFLSDRRGAVPVKEIVARTNGLSSQTVSGQLDKLEAMGYVRKTPVGRESHYELREPLLRMVIEKKRGRGEPIRLVIDFLRRWYSRDERHSRLTLAPAHATLTRQYWEASLDLDRALKDTPDPARAEKLSPDYWEAREASDFARAAEIAAEIIERKGHRSTADDWFERAYCLQKSGDFRQAVSNYDKVLQIDPDNVSAWNNRGYALLKLGRHADALDSLDKALQIDPDATYAWFNRGNIFLLGDQWDEFIQTLERGFAVKSFSDERRGDTKSYCRILLKQGGRDEAEKVATLATLHAKHNAVPQLGQDLIGSIPALFDPEITQDRADAWLAAWNAAGQGKPDLAIPLRLLTAAVAWKPKRDVRALLALAIEERRILERLLPAEADGAR